MLNEHIPNRIVRARLIVQKVFSLHLVCNAPQKANFSEVFVEFFFCLQR